MAITIKDPTGADRPPKTVGVKLPSEQNVGEPETTGLLKEQDNIGFGPSDFNQNLASIMALASTLPANVLQNPPRPPIRPVAPGGAASVPPTGALAQGAGGAALPPGLYQPTAGGNVRGGPNPPLYTAANLMSFLGGGR